MRLGVIPAVLLISVLSSFAQNERASQIRNSKHDFSISSASNIKSSTKTEICMFCHAPHNGNASVPMWNRSLSAGTNYSVYSSLTMAQPSPTLQNTDSSKMCLSCHDGQLALGDTINNGRIRFQNVPGGQALPSSKPLILADDHPIAVVQDTANTQLKPPAKGDAVRLDKTGKVQCATCHDPHKESIDPTEKRFLVKSNSMSGICTTCHSPNGGAGANRWSWNGSFGSASSHAIATNSYTPDTNGGNQDLGAHTGYRTTAANGCESCHRPHTAAGTTQLLKSQVDQVCFQCHDGNPTTNLVNIKAEFAKAYVHPVIGPQPGHNPNETPNGITNRHATCEDCHNSHAASGSTSAAVPPQLSSALYGISGITATGGVHDPRHGTGDAEYEYEICFKCHSYAVNRPQKPGYSAYGTQPNRQVPSADLVRAFSSTSSFHPVARPRGLSSGPGGEVPSLLPAPVDGSGAPIRGRTLSSSSQIYCTDCHNSDGGRNLGGVFAGAAGPHGSNISHILERKYLIETAITTGPSADVPYSASNYALCYKCHSEQNLLNDASFPHQRHVSKAACSTCHDPHGVPGGSSNNARLINFDLNLVLPSKTTGNIRYTLTGLHHGSCSLSCHGHDHANSLY